MRRFGSSIGIAAALGALVSAPAGAVDPRTTLFVTNRDSSDVALIDTRTDRLVGRIALGEFVNPHMAMVTPDGKSLLVAGTNRNEAIVVDLSTREVRFRIPVGRQPEHFDVSGDGRLALVGNLGDGTVSVLDLERGAEVRRLSGFAEPHGLAFLPGGAKAYVSSFGAHEVASLRVAEDVEVARRLAVGSSHLLAAADPDRFLAEIKGIANPTLTLDGRFVYAADGDSGEVAVIDTETDEVVKTLRVGEEPWRAYPSPDGTKMLVPNNGDETVSVLDARRHEVVATLPGGPGMTGVNFSAGGRKAYVFSSGEAAAILIYDLERLAPLGRRVLGTGVRLETGSATPDGEKIYVAASTENSVYVLRTATDTVERIANVGQSPWATAILGSYQYCH